MGRNMRGGKERGRKGREADEKKVKGRERRKEKKGEGDMRKGEGEEIGGCTHDTTAAASTGMGDRLRRCNPPRYFTKPPRPT